jgi:two-component system, chemotaxis family, protein-glutamate methylesterase/glutaminase
MLRTPSTVRVLVVDDSATVRARIVDALRADPGIEVVGEASDGKMAITLCQELRPDVVTMDMVLPGVTGLVATEHLMAHCPTPILVISAATNRGELVSTRDALTAGAVDVLEKPSGGEADGEWDGKLVKAVKMVARIQVITHLGLRRGPDRPPVADPAPSRAANSVRDYSVVAIGASTGGPGAVASMLSGLPRSFALPVLLVLHVGESFAGSLTQWLEGVTGRPVRLAEHGRPVASAAGQVIMAPAGRHMVVQGGRLALTSTPPRQSCRPSVDELFESVAAQYGPRSAGCLLTGMGRDGAEGLLSIDRAGGLTIAQDEATSVVYGMPREAVLRGAVQHLLPLEQIGATLATLTGRQAEVKQL